MGNLLVKRHATGERKAGWDDFREEARPTPRFQESQKLVTATSKPMLKAKAPAKMEVT